MKNLQKHKTVSLLKSLSSKELVSFIKFVESPYLNGRKEIIQLVRLLTRNGDPFYEVSLGREEIFFEIFPGEVYNYAKLRVTLTYLNRLIIEFLAQEYQKNNAIHYPHIALLALEEKGHHKLLKNGFDKARNNLHKQTHKDENFFLNDFLLEFSALETHQADPDQRVKAKKPQKILFPLDNYYLLYKSRLAAMVFHRNTQYNEPIENPEYWKAFFTYIQSFPEHSLHLLPRIYMGIAIIFKQIQVKEEDQYLKLKKEFMADVSNISDHHIIEISGYMVNYCYRRYLNTHSHYLNELFDWYQFMIGQSTFVKYPAYLLGNYKNMITVSLRLKKHDWAEMIVEKYKDVLPVEVRADAYHYNLAQINFQRAIRDEEKNKEEFFSKVLSNLHVVDFIDFFYKISRDILLVKTYYEAGMEGRGGESIRYMSKSAQNYIRRNKVLTTTRKQQYLAFYRVVKRLLKARELLFLGRVFDISLFIQQIQNTNPLQEKLWLLGKAQELQEKN